MSERGPRSRAAIRTEALYRRAMLRLLHRSLPLILVTEYPKSGASWLAQMLSALIDYPFPRQRFPALGRAIYHGHYLPASRGPTIVMWRDPRDIMVSWYYHTLFVSDRNHPAFVARYRAALQFGDVDDIRNNLPRFIELNFRTPLSPRFSFNDFFDAWHDRNDVVHCHYEALHAEPKIELARVATALGFAASPERVSEIAARFSFSSQAHRAPGTEDKRSYLRKGVVGDWHNHFSNKARQMMAHHLGDRLIRLGYESDDAWVAASSPPVE